MESCLEQLKNLLNEEDRFCRYNGIRVESIRPGSAEAVMEVRDESLNGLGAVQGGAIFTLADLALAAAANSRGSKAVTQNSTISYLRPGSGRKLRKLMKKDLSDFLGNLEFDPETTEQMVNYYNRVRRSIHPDAKPMEF